MDRSHGKGLELAHIHKNLIFFTKIVRGEADCAVESFAYTLQRMGAVDCVPGTIYEPLYFWSKYPPETTKLWNMLEMMDPPTYFLTFLSMLAIVVFMKLMTKYGTKLGLKSATTELICVPFQ